MEQLDVVVDRRGQLNAGLPGLPVEQFDLHPAPEGLDDGAVVRATHRADRWRKARFAYPLAEGLAGELHPAVGVDHSPACGSRRRVAIPRALVTSTVVWVVSTAHPAT